MAGYVQIVERLRESWEPTEHFKEVTYLCEEGCLGRNSLRALWRMVGGKGFVSQMEASEEATGIVKA